MMAGFDAAHMPHRTRTVFDGGQPVRRPSAPIGLGQSGSSDGLIFRNTERDRQPPSKVVTAALLGDPTPGRVIPPGADYGLRRSTTGPDAHLREPAPIHLTFAAMRTAYGET